ncbi:hypothetical protein BZL30_8480 [Mycobacterium kansasii]|uniref:Uncharacterized protein n=1 Tax=Mycobacterium kansasii TaxID=1768 RepID=A0A1V3WK23_MYCKA|nr:hypothetical protein BZL30_8480 [Mycobacterium kansasii]
MRRCLIHQRVEVGGPSRAVGPTRSQRVTGVPSSFPPRSCNSATTASYSASNTSTVAPESRSMNASSLATSRQFNGTTTSPARAAP